MTEKSGRRHQAKMLWSVNQVLAVSFTVSDRWHTWSFFAICSPLFSVPTSFALYGSPEC